MSGGGGHGTTATAEVARISAQSRCCNSGDSAAKQDPFADQHSSQRAEPWIPLIEWGGCSSVAIDSLRDAVRRLFEDK